MINEVAQDLSQPLLRQRRNLMIISVLMIFVHMSGAEFNKVVFMGLTITFKQPQVVVLFMFGFLIYFLYRYYLYLGQEKGRDFKGTFFGKLNALSHQKLQQLKNEEVDLEQYGGKFQFKDMKKTSFWKRNVATIVHVDDEGSQQWGYFEIDIRRFTFKGIRALFYTLFKRSYVTDYILPYVLALIALWVNYSKVMDLLKSMK